MNKRLPIISVVLSSIIILTGLSIDHQGILTLEFNQQGVRLEVDKRPYRDSVNQ